ncbi:replication-associated recombination protein A [Crenalkalicoccus roseus]|uniref:replication-associated recombination protein A n=1 Tax=Crenalkalicoccus roseus TaxID=1485588 RepID=UPI001080ED6A|nr:replication-associated recombination protein A [Crenalkalicoccus roseus]
MTAGSLFEDQAPRPLADRLRPTSLAEVVGQDHLLSPEGPLGRMARAGAIRSCVLWGPPGCGKTTIARLLAEGTRLHFVPMSAIFSGVADLRKAFEEARRRRLGGQGTLVFVDEIHRFNRAQQDAFLPHVEDGTIILVGATTENPSFELNAALLSRLQVFVLRRLDEAALSALLARAERAMGRRLPLDEAARATLLAMADGDGRYLLSLCEALSALPPGEAIGAEALPALLQRRAPVYDKAEEAHYNLLSAYHKSLRSSDCDASLYWMARMLLGGEDPGVIFRRLICCAAEDVGLADPAALQLVLAAWQAFDRVGLPEGELMLAEATIYVATAPKSNASYLALHAAKELAARSGSLPPPTHAVNAPTRLMKELGYGRGYVYDHDVAEGSSGLDYLPEGLGRPGLYAPRERGFEREVRKRVEYWARLREERRRGKGG